MGDARDEPDEVGAAPVEYRLLDLDDGELAGILAALAQAGVRHRVGQAALEVHPDDEELADAVLDELYGTEDEELVDAVFDEDGAGDETLIDAVFDEDGAGDEALLDAVFEDEDGSGYGGSAGPAGPDEVAAEAAGAGSGRPEFDAALLRVEELAATGGPVYDLDGYDAEALELLVGALERARVRYALASDGSLIVHRNDEHLTDALLDETFGPQPGTEPHGAGAGGGTGPAPLPQSGAASITAAGVARDRLSWAERDTTTPAPRRRWLVPAVAVAAAAVIVVVLMLLLG